MAPVPKEYYSISEGFRFPLKKKGFTSLETIVLYGIFQTYPVVYLQSIPATSNLEISPLTISINAAARKENCYIASASLELKGYLKRIYRSISGATRSEVRYILNVPLLISLLEDLNMPEIK